MTEFPQTWSATILAAPPMIAPARQFTWPRPIAGEEDALARGAVMVELRPQNGPVCLLTCARGFADPAMPSAIHACPNPDEICVVAGGYAYLAPAAKPERCVHLPLRPVVMITAAVEAGLLLFTGFQTIVAWGRDGQAWQTARLSWEGLRLTTVDATEARGFGWDLMEDAEREFVIDLRTGRHTGSPFPPRT